MEKDNPIEETPFNMAMLYYMELHKLRISVDTFYTEQNYPACYRQLRLLFAKISKKLTTNEKEEITNTFKDIRDNLNVKIGGNLGQQILSMSILSADDKLIKVYTKLNNLMFKYRMIFPKITTVGLKDLEKRYDL